MFITVRIHLTEKITNEKYDKLIEIRELIYNEVTAKYENISIDYAF